MRARPHRLRIAKPDPHKAGVGVVIGQVRRAARAGQRPARGDDLPALCDALGRQPIVPVTGGAALMLNSVRPTAAGSLVGDGRTTVGSTGFL